MSLTTVLLQEEGRLQLFISAFMAFLKIFVISFKRPYKQTFDNVIAILGEVFLLFVYTLYLLMQLADLHTPLSPL